MHFSVSLLLVFLLAGCVYFFVIHHDFASHLPNTQKTKNQPVLVPLKSISALETAFPMPTPVPVAEPTPIPASAYSKRVRVSQPLSQDIPCNVNLTEYAVEKCENGLALMLRGWGYIEQKDAALSTIYLVICASDAQQMWFYQTINTPGATGIEHDGATGTNLDRADFTAIVDVSDYPDGRYTLGLAILNELNEQEDIGSFAPFQDQYTFHVRHGNIISTRSH